MPGKAGCFQSPILVAREASGLLEIDGGVYTARPRVKLMTEPLN